MALLRAVLIAAGLVAATISPAFAQGPAQARGNTYSSNEIVDAGHRFFGVVSRDLALLVEKAAAQWGEPNGYILGQEASGAITVGLRYGEGVLHTRNAGSRKVFWHRRFAGLSGSAYLVGGLGMTALTAGNTVVVPIRSGLGVRLGANIGYLKFTQQSTWNPF